MSRQGLFAAQLEEFEAEPARAAEYLKTGTAPTGPDLPAPRHAATAVVVNALMNLDECVTER